MHYSRCSAVSALTFIRAALQRVLVQERKEMSGWFEASKARQWRPAFWRSSMQAPGGRSARSCPFSLTVTRLPGRCVHLIFLHSVSVAGSTTCWAHIVQMQQTCHRCVTAARVQALARLPAVSWASTRALSSLDSCSFQHLFC